MQWAAFTTHESGPPCSPLTDGIKMKEGCRKWEGLVTGVAGIARIYGKRRPSMATGHIDGRRTVIHYMELPMALAERDSW